jgi:hypothetical protein
MTFEPRDSTTREKKRRLLDYRVSAHQLNRLVKNRNWKIIFLENSTNELKLNNFIDELTLDFDYYAYFVNENRGETNKGLGELHMLDVALKKLGDEIFKADKVIYFTGRRIITNHYLIEKVEFSDAEILASNPPFVGFDDSFSPPTPNLINDMFFAMAPNLIIKYSEFCQDFISKHTNLSIGSEQMLFQFVTSCDSSIQWIEHLGLIRRQEKKYLSLYPKNNFHII